ncbi:MAG: hypothetical protein AAGD22_10535, partial [Verrucomicrobiota bacterium]
LNGRLELRTPAFFFKQKEAEKLASGKRGSRGAVAGGNGIWCRETAARSRARASSGKGEGGGMGGVTDSGAAGEGCDKVAAQVGESASFWRDSGRMGEFL